MKNSVKSIWKISKHEVALNVKNLSYVVQDKGVDKSFDDGVISLYIGIFY